MGWATQLALGATRQRVDSDRSTVAALSAKSQLIGGGEQAPSLTLAYGVAYERPSGDKWAHQSTFATAVVTAPVRDWLLHANLGAVAERAPSRKVGI